MKGTPEKKLYDDAVAKGDAKALEELLRKDTFLLNKVSLSKSTGKTPLHIAAAEGYIEMASILLEKSPKMCWSRDGSGMNPIHVAAMNGRDKVLEKLVEKEPFAAMERLDRGETALHLCVKHRQLKALKVLVEKLDEFVCEEDDNGETVLHLAVRLRQVEMVRYLVKDTNIDKMSKNSKGQTPLKLVKHRISYSGVLDDDIIQIKILLSPAAVASPAAARYSSQSQTADFITRKRDAIMVVAILIATMAFQAAVSPTGGVWQDDTEFHRAGEAVMAYKDPHIYKNFIRSNTVAFVTSLSTILLLIIGLPFKYRFFMWALVVIMWVSVTAVGVTYGASIMVATPRIHKKSLSHVIQIGIISWISLMVSLLVGNTLRLLHRWSRTQFDIHYCFKKCVVGGEA